MQMVSGGWKHQERILARRMMLAAMPLSVGLPPKWYFREPRQPPVVPSDLGELDRLLPLPLLTDEQLYCGQFVHKLFEILPYLPADKWSEAAGKIAACWQGLLY